MNTVESRPVQNLQPGPSTLQVQAAYRNCFRGNNRDASEMGEAHMCVCKACMSRVCRYHPELTSKAAQFVYSVTLCVLFRHYVPEGRAE